MYVNARIFTASSEVLKDPAELPDPKEKGIEPYERDKRKKAVEKASEDKLRSMMESALRGNEGQGKFMKLSDSQTGIGTCLHHQLWIKFTWNICWPDCTVIKNQFFRVEILRQITCRCICASKIYTHIVLSVR